MAESRKPPPFATTRANGGDITCIQWGKDIQQPAGGDRAARVRHVRRDDDDQPARQPMGHAADDDLELAFEHVDHLFVRVVMLGERRPRVGFDPRVGRPLAMDHACAIAGEDFPHR